MSYQKYIDESVKASLEIIEALIVYQTAQSNWEKLPDGEKQIYNGFSEYLEVCFREKFLLEALNQ